MEKEIIIHIGLPRAGSTFLQDKVFSNLDPSILCFNPSKISQELLPDFMRRVHVNNGYSESNLFLFREQIKGVIGKIPQKKILISNEGLCGLDFRPWKNTLFFRNMLKSIFPNATMIIVFRDQVEWLRSAYYLALKYGCLITFNKFINYRDGKFIDSNNNDYWSHNALNLDFSILYNLYNENFRDVITIDFNDLKNNHERLIKIIEEITDARLMRKITFERVNKSISKREMRMIGKLSEIFFYQKYWKEKYTFIPNYYKSSFRHSDSLFVKLKYILIQALRFLIFYSGSYMGKIFYKEKDLFDAFQLKFLCEYYEKKNSEFWNKQKINKLKFKIPND